jgi:hypothetical protein
MKFDMRKNDWHIKINSKDQFIAVRQWLIFNGLSCMYSSDWSPGIVGIDCCAEDEKWIRLFPGEDSYRPEVKLHFVTTVRHAEYPELKSGYEKQLDNVMAKLAELQKEAEQLQETIKKEKK